MKSIVVASDLSVRSDRAMRRAAQLAKQHGARLTLLHVVDEDLPTNITDQMLKTGQDALQDFIATMKVDNAEAVVKIGDPVQAIIAVADDLEVDLIVLGVHKTRPFWDMFSGTTMERVVRGTNRPVLLVSDPVNGAYSSVVCGVDLSPSCVAAAHVAVTVAPDATFSTFHAMHVPYRGFVAPNDQTKMILPFVKDAQQRLDSWWKDAGMPAEMKKPEVTVAGVHQAFETTRAKVDGELFALGAHGRSAISPTLLGGFTEAQMREPSCDILVART